MTDPVWLTQAFKYEGFHEVGENRGIEQFISLAGAGSLGDAWCAIFANAMFQSVGVHGTRSAVARSFSDSEFMRQISDPIRGCVVVLWRVSPTSDKGHVGFWLGEDDQGILMLSGNDDDQVEQKHHPVDRLIGYYWPTTAPTLPPAPQLQRPSVTDARFRPCLAVTLKWEGGNDDDARDPGGRTSRGILQTEWDGWRAAHPGLPSDVWQAPQDQIEAIYKQEYWDKHHCAEFLPGVDLAVFDARVLSGGAIRFIQRALGVEDDGVIDSGGPTVKAARSHPPKDVINAICDARMVYLHGLAGWPTFGNGWSNRVTDVRAQALAAVSTTLEPPVTDQPSTLPVPVPPPLQPGGPFNPADLTDFLKTATEFLRQKAGTPPPPPPPPPVPQGPNMGAALATFLPWFISVLPQISALLAPVFAALVQGGVMGAPGATTTGTTVGTGLLSLFGTGILNWVKTALTPPPPAPSKQT